MYKLGDGFVRNLDTGACIPLDESNTDYQVFLAWKAEGNTPEGVEGINPAIAILARIDGLERASLLNRGSRELHMRIIEQQAAGNTSALMAQPYYVKLKAIDDEIKALRAQL